MTNLDQFRANLPGLDAQQRLEALLPRIEAARAQLRTLAPDELVGRSGGHIDDTGDLSIDFMGRAYRVDVVEFKVRRADTGEEPSTFVQSIVLVYLATADGTPPSDRWIGFRDLPDGLFYAQAFQGYSGAEMIRGLKGNMEAFKQPPGALQGQSIAIGEAGYAFRVLPRVRLAIAMWAGDEDFPAQAQVLFEDSAPHYLPTDGLAILGGQLVGLVLKSAKGTR